MSRFSDWPETTIRKTGSLPGRAKFDPGASRGLLVECWVSMLGGDTGKIPKHAIPHQRDQSGVILPSPLHEEQVEESTTHESLYSHGQVDARPPADSELTSVNNLLTPA